MSEALQSPGVALRSEDLIALRQVAISSDAAPVLAALPGGFPTRRKGHGLEVADMREYVSGDDIRRLDRGTTARTGRLHVRQFQEERDRVTLLVADFRAPMFWGLKRAFRSVVAAEVLAQIGWSVVEQGGRVSLLAITDTDVVAIPPRGRVRGMLDVIGGLVQAHEKGLTALLSRSTDENSAPLDQSLARVERLTPPGGEIVIASGFDDPGRGLADRLAALARRRLPQLVLITDGDADRLPAGRYPLRLADGRLVRVQLHGKQQSTQDILQPIAGREALVIHAEDPVEVSARRVAAAYPMERRA